MFQPVAVGALGEDRLILRILGDRQALRVVTRAGVPDTRWFAEGAVPTRLGDLVLSEPAAWPIRAFDAGDGLRFFTGSKIFDGTGALVHRIDFGALGIDEAVSSAAWLGGNEFAVVEADTSTVVVFSVP
jgi:hypothetical protein